MQNPNHWIVVWITPKGRSVYRRKLAIRQALALVDILQQAGMRHVSFYSNQNGLCVTV